ncbi:NADH-dependent reduced ferredoxin:NADP+ oxidoreductase subunit A [hydrothermal vent metagenome]|uniref:NADH-dependent reduced ferredoxin:NADP+ oxidoreductase subunit A n=1 Tax=hydrothermal vent metagenome TaxID=652676 RepID=A0A3B0VFS4_9ZZZZ
MYEITEKRDLAHRVSLFKIKAPRIARKRQAGQFVVLRLGEHGERIPFTIVESDNETGTISIVVQEVGRTSSLLCQKEKGDSILDVVGPLGKPTHIENFGRAVCVGGGIGTAVVLPIGSALKAAGNEVVSIVGARNKDLLILEEEITAASTQLLVTTDDGSYGHHGFVTNVLEDLIKDGRKIDIVIAIGPVPMMRAVAEVTRPYGLKTLVSLNPIMVDGTGMCGSCRVTVNGKNQFVCVDGPEFDGHGVDFKELVLRNRSYLKEERIAMDEANYHEGTKCYERGDCS